MHQKLEDAGNDGAEKTDCMPMRFITIGFIEESLDIEAVKVIGAVGREEIDEALGNRHREG